MNSLKLNRLNSNKIDAKKANKIKGGNCCGCSCAGPSGSKDNATANWNGNLHSQGSVIICDNDLGDFLFWGGY